MKKLFIIPAILATAFSTVNCAVEQQPVSPVADVIESAVDSKATTKDDSVFFVEQKELKISDDCLIKFSNLTGYKKYDEAKKKEKGILIGFKAEFEINDETRVQSIRSYYFVNDEYSNQSWWHFDSAWLRRISALNLNAKCPFTNDRQIKVLTNFINIFDALTSHEKNEYISGLKAHTEQLMDNCEEWNYKELTAVLQILNYINDKQDLSKADKIALFLAIRHIQAERCVQDELALGYNDSIPVGCKCGEKYEKMFTPVKRDKLCFVGDCDKLILITSITGDCLKFSNLTGYKSEQDANEDKNGFICGIFCEARSCMTANFYAFIKPEFVGQEIWVNALFRTEKLKIGTNSHDLAQIETCWTNFMSMNLEQKTNFLNELKSKPGKYKQQMSYFDVMSFGWLESAAGMIKLQLNGGVELESNKFVNAYKIMLYLAKVKSDALVEGYFK